MRLSGFGDLLHGEPVDQAEITRVRDAVMFEQPQLRKRLVRFGALLVLAAAIATYGLMGDAVATVIGAMIVAPLMLPIVGLAFAVSIGDGKAIFSSILVGVAGMIAVVAVGFILAHVPISVFDPTNNAQIMSRTSPRLLDLAAALATGLAGAFAVGRKDVSDTLPGVAIAISLVPPLANVGILLASGLYSLALGSLLLFMTNYFAILITGILVFGLMRYPQVSLVRMSVRSRRLAIALAIAMVMLIGIPLGFSGSRIADQNSAEAQAAQATTEWVKGTGYQFVSATANGQTVTIVIAGHGTLPPERRLQDSLTGRVSDMAVEVDVVPTQTLRFSTVEDGG